MGGTLALSANASFVLDYDQEEFIYRGVLVSPGYDARGHLNYERLPGTVSKWRGNVAAEYYYGAHTFYARVNYIDGVVDDRGPVAVQTGGWEACTLANAGVAAGCVLSSAPINIGSFTTADLTWLWQFNDVWSFNASVLNMFDRDPPQARTSRARGSQTAPARCATW